VVIDSRHVTIQALTEVSLPGPQAFGRHSPTSPHPGGCAAPLVCSIEFFGFFLLILSYSTTFLDESPDRSASSRYWLPQRPLPILGFAYFAELYI